MKNQQSIQKCLKTLHSFPSDLAVSRVLQLPSSALTFIIASAVLCDQESLQSLSISFETYYTRSSATILRASWSFQRTLARTKAALKIVGKHRPPLSRSSTFSTPNPLLSTTYACFPPHHSSIPVKSLPNASLSCAFWYRRIGGRFILFRVEMGSFGARQH